MNDATQWRHIAKISAHRQAHIVFARRAPTFAVVGWVIVEPALTCRGFWQIGQIRQVRQIDRYPRMRCVAAAQRFHAGRWLGHQVATDIARRHTKTPQASDHDVSEILANPFSLRQGCQRRRVDLGAFAFIHKVGVNSSHQITRGQVKRHVRQQTGACIRHKVGMARNEGRGKQKLCRRVVSRTRHIAEALAHLSAGY